MTFSLLALSLAIIWIVFGTTRFKLHPFLVLLSSSIFLAIATGVPLPELPSILGKGFGKTIQSIGLLIIFGTIIGVILEVSLATQTLALVLLKGLQRLPLPYAVSCIGYLVSIPVFCDSAFVILSSLNKSLSKRTKTPLVALTVALSTGLFAPHVLVPPTPGPLAAAANLELENLFLLIIYGGILAFILIIAGASYAYFLAKRLPYEETKSPIKQEESELSNLPSFKKSIAPIVIPIVLMAFGTFISFIEFYSNLKWLHQLLKTLCSPVFALGIGMLFSFRLLEKSTGKISNLVQKGIVVAAPILVITGMGGTLGLIIQQLPLTEFVEQSLTDTGWGLLIPFLIAAILKTSQGSSTVAIITASSIAFPLLGVLGLDYEIGKIWVILSIGVGSMTVSHANDSYFWIVSQMGGLDIKTAYKHHTFGTFIQGVLGILIILLGHWLSVHFFN
ncbi:MAG: GntP family permease [Flavobacteriaceae bacterium]|nr:GntP family permease [Flavobacteriaceae bacterium]